MELNENQIIEKHGEQWMHCMRNTLLPYEHEWTCLSVGYNIIKRKHRLTKLQRKKISVIDSRKKVKCVCIDICRIYEGDDFKEFFNV